jgi:hypothetical protein
MKPILFDSPVLGEYAVAEACIVKFIDPAKSNEVSRGVVVDNGKGLYGLGLTAGSAVYGVYRKIHTSDNDHDR